MQDFLAVTELETGLHTISDSGELIDFHYTSNGSDDLAVFFHGAVPGKKIPSLKLPIFSGSQISLGADVDRVMLSDATMAIHQKLRLGWFSGSKDFDLSQRLDKILNKICALRTRKRVVLMGGSQGGFAALRASRKLPGSIALVWNPQTRIKYFSWTSHLTGYMRYGFDVQNYDALPLEVTALRRMDLTQHYAETTATNFVFLMQNLEDDDHLQNHARPLFESGGGDAESIHLGINAANERFILALGDWEGGHSLPDRASLEAIASLFFLSPLPTAELFNTCDFLTHLPPSFIGRRSKAAPDAQEQATSVMGLSTAERAFLTQEFGQASKYWFLQYGITNVLEEVCKMQFGFVTAIDQSATRVAQFRQRLEKSLGHELPDGIALEHRENAEGFLSLQRNVLATSQRLPSVVYVHSRNAAEVCDALVRRCREVTETKPPDVYVFNAADIDLEPAFREDFVCTAKTERIRKFSPEIK